MSAIEDLLKLPTQEKTITIIQGSTYVFPEPIILKDYGDYTGWTREGHIRKNYRNDSPVLANWIIDAEYGNITYNDIVYPNSTIFYPSLVYSLVTRTGSLFITGGTE